MRSACNKVQKGLNPKHKLSEDRINQNLLPTAGRRKEGDSALTVQEYQLNLPNSPRKKDTVANATAGVKKEAFISSIVYQ